MLPVHIDKTQCLESLVGLRTGCTVSADFPYWFEDIEGVDLKKLSQLAKGSNPSGTDYAQQLINSAAREMLGDIELLLNNGYKLQEVVGDVCSSCSLLPVYTANAGIKVVSAISSRFKTLRITRLSILVNVSGSKQIVIDDGIDPKYYTPTFTAGILTPINIDYQTDQKSVTIYFTDSTIGLGQVSCIKKSSCGCGRSETSDNPVFITGILNGVETTTQYGFLPCAAIGCSNEILTCSLIKQTPNIFGLTLLYKLGEKYHLNKFVSDRNNEATVYNGEEKPELLRNYSKLYNDRLKGTATTSSIKKVINDYLSLHKKDKCIICDSKRGTAYAVG